jgi:hypothetical protein
MGGEKTAIEARLNGAGEIQICSVEVCVNIGFVSSVFHFVVVDIA